MKNTITVVNDDLDGSEGAELHTFSLDGMEFEIDLSEGNSIEFYALMDRYTAPGVARRTSNGRSGARFIERSRRAQEALGESDEAPPEEPQDESQETPAAKPKRSKGKAKQATKVPATPATIRAWWADHPDGLPGWRPAGPIPGAVMTAWQQFEQKG
jgi:Lsr2